VQFSPGTTLRDLSESVMREVIAQALPKNASRKPQQSRQKGNRIVTICGGRRQWEKQAGHAENY
jgi:hypothetical protein